MQTTSEVRVGPVAQVFGAVGMAAIFMGLLGVYWDVGHHATLGWESSWMPPRLPTHAGTALFFYASLCGLLLTRRRARSFLRAARTGHGLAAAMLGSIVEVGAAPLDDLWHRLHGRDVTVWSPPHLMGVAGAPVGVYGMTCALGAGLPRGERRGPPTMAAVKRAMQTARLRLANRSTANAAWPCAATRRATSRMFSFRPKASWITTTPGDGPSPSGRDRKLVSRSFTLERDRSRFAGRHGFSLTVADKPT